MVHVTFIDADGNEHRAESPAPMSLMELAITNEIPSIVGICGGMCSCATCHCYVSEPWASRLPAPDSAEEDTLTHVLDRRPESRLGCQIKLSESLNGMVVNLPSRQRVP
jgi:2Fe-2S ferredoxin